ncbi:MAG TPA: enoyl-CoA hydratase/isomerase family protein [Deltaproteobacteria bacterium]|nr:enoyl-CoA hydratase/isomerase family protein [Deltaproteobacteria bacterium]
MAYSTIEYEVHEKGIGVLSLNRPDKYNAVNSVMTEELYDFWGQRQYDLDTQVIILKGNGEKGFCAGLDMTETMERSAELSLDEFYNFQARLGRLNLAMRQVSQPIICAVHGAAAGLGFSFALASDLRVVSSDARFSAAYINIGLGGADMSCSYFLPRLIGAGRAYEFMLTGNFMSAQEAMDLGLASRMVEKDKVFDTALELAKIMITKNPMGLKLTKEAINMSLHAGSLEHALNMEDRNQVLLVARGMLGAKASKHF